MVICFVKNRKEKILGYTREVVCLLLITSAIICFPDRFAFAGNGLMDSHNAKLDASADASPAVSYTLAESIQHGLKANPKIKEAEYEIQKAESAIGEKRGRFFPQLSAQSYSERINSLHSKGPTDEDYVDQRIDLINVRLSQTLFDGFTIFNAYQKAILNKELAQAQKDKEEFQLILDIQKNFLDLLKAREDAKSLKESVSRLEVNKASARAFFEKEMVPYVKVLEAEVDMADARQKLSQAQNTVEIQRERLNVLLGLPAQENIVYRGRLKEGASEFSGTLRSCLDCAYENRPEIRVVRKSLEIARKDEAIAQGELSPRVSVNADYYYRDNDYDEPGVLGDGETYDRDQRNSYWSGNIQLRWDFGLGGQQFYGIGKYAHEVSRLEQKALSVRNGITSEVRTNFLRIQETRGRIRSTMTALEAARESYARAKKRFELKMGTISELLDNQSRLTRAEANHTQAIADYQISLARLYNAMGKRNYSLKDQSEKNWSERN